MAEQHLNLENAVGRACRVQDIDSISKAKKYLITYVSKPSLGWETRSIRVCAERMIFRAARENLLLTYVEGAERQ